MRHDFAVTGGYDPALDGPDRQWGRLAVECSLCGETRRIWRGLPLADAGLTYGCPAAWVTADPPADVVTFAAGGRPDGGFAVPELAVLLAQARARHRASIAVTLAAVVLCAFMVASITTGRWPSLPISWGAVMCDAGLITWGVLALRRTPPGLGSGHGEQAAGGVHGGPDGGDRWQPGPDGAGQSVH